MIENFFDYNSTTPVDSSALEEMLPFFSECFANPSAQTSEMSWKSQAAISKAKTQIANFIGCMPKEITFTSGATESINWVFEDFFKAKKNVLVSSIDHDASFEKAKSNSLGVFYDVDKNGQTDLVSFEKACSEMASESLVNLMYAHNELGSLLDLSSLIKIAKKHSHFVHLDATQALGKSCFNFKDSGADFLSCSAHKFYGPKGIGVLVTNSQTVSLSPLILGGGQQNNLRSGTLNTPLIVGFGKASEVAFQRLDQDLKHYDGLRKTFLEELSTLDFHLNSDLENSLKNTLNITFNDWKSLAPLHLELSPFSVSQGSACSSETSSNRILKEIGQANGPGTLRISFGRPSTAQKTRDLAQAIKSALSKD